MPSGPVFTNVKVLPSYGQNEARIRWEVKSGYEDANFIVQRSPDGIANFETIHSEQSISNYVDPDFRSHGKLDAVYYKIILQHSGERHDSQPVNTFGTLTRDEFGTAQAIMEQEASALRFFTKVWVFNRNIFGPRCPRCVDPDTGQSVGRANCPQCYGTGYDGGFRTPIQSYAQFISRTGRRQVNTQAGSVDPIKDTARMLAFPELWHQDMVVVDGGKDRYLVDGADISYLNGKVPLIATKVEMELLRKSDIRYELPIPEDS